MSCDAVAAAAFLHYAALVRGGAPAATLARLELAAAKPPAPLAREPLFAAIVAAAHSLEVEADGLRHAPRTATDRWRGDEWEGFKARAAKLSQMDMQGHLELAKRGTDGDLKCILRGISQDLPRKVAAVEAAATPAARRTALDEAYFLLRDNVEVITTPAKDTSTDVTG